MKVTLTLLLFISCCFSLSANTDVYVSGINYQPNYKYSHAKKHDLTDGIYKKRYLWVNNKSTVWQNISPIVIDLAVINSQLIGKSGKLRVHTSSSPKAGLYPPRFIDLYKIENGRYFPIASKLFEFKVNYENHDLWLDIDIDSIPKNISIVLHANKQFLAVDEIAVVSSVGKNSVHGNISDNSLSAADGLIDRSLNRLKKLLRQKNRNKDKLNVSLNYHDQIVSLPPCESNCKHVVELSGYSGEEEAVLVITPDKACMIQFEDGPGLRTYLIGKVQSLDGILVNDIVKPLSKQSHLVKKSTTFKAAVVFDEQISDRVVHSIWIRCGENDEHVVEIHSSMVSIDLNNKKLDVNVWAYPSHFDGRVRVDEVYNDLRKNGVSFVTIHPNNIPFKYDDRDRIKRFIRIISEVPDDFKILLFLDLQDIDENVVNFFGHEVKLHEWLKYLQVIMSEVKKSTNDWVLYPIDEARGSQINILYKFSDRVKRIQSDINIFANPINDSSGKVTRMQLLKLNKVIDYWQPSIKLAAEQPGFFGKVDNFFVYENPTYPSKSEKIEFFRKLPIRALCHGASGVGFWAYNENGGTSPYDDFDGKSADWSVVYMEDGSLVRSARWDAFKEGVDDYKLFRYGLSNYSTDIKNEYSELCTRLQSKDWLGLLYNLRERIINLHAEN